MDLAIVSIRRKLSSRTLIFLALAVSLLASSTAPGADLKWDEWGVPHIVGTDESDALFAFGWSQMRAHANTALRLIAHTRGITAELLGPGDNDAALDSDSWVRMMGVQTLAQSWLVAQNAEEKEIIGAFVAGENAYAAAHPELIQPALKQVLPVTPRDVMARLIDLTMFTLAVDQEELKFVVNRWQKGGYAAPRSSAAAAGSNGWAIGPKRTSQANALLLVNPHLAWTDQTRLMEADIRYGDVHIYGATFIGFPFLAVGFNDSLGWTHTVNPMHSFYLYQLKQANGGYSWNGKPQAYEVRDEHFQVRRLGGFYNADHALLVRSSFQGPVVAEHGDTALALWVTGRDAPHVIGQYWAMARSRKFADFSAAIGRQQAPIFSIIYADRDGHIYYNFGGRNPSGPAESKRGHRILDGTTDRTLWTGVIPLAELPNLLDPPSGWIQNANDPPWTSTWPSLLQEAKFPAGLVTEFGDFTNLRAQQVIRELLVERPLGLADVVALKHLTHAELADRILDDLISAGRRSSDEDARAASEVLAKWDRNVDAQSRGASVFAAYLLLTPTNDSTFREPFDSANPLTTPRGLGDTAAAAARLAEAARVVKHEEGQLDAPWGDHHKLQWGEHNAAANGAPDPLGMPRSTSYKRDPEHGGFVATGGDSFVAVVAFGAAPAAQGLLSYGNFTETPPAGTREQFPLYAEKRLRKIEFDFDQHSTVLMTEVVGPSHPAH